MTSLLFFSRVALLCNGCFLIVFLMHYLPDLHNGIIPSTMIILGNVVSILINVLVNVWYGILLIGRKAGVHFLPVWIAVINFLFFVFQVILLVK